MQDAQQQSQLSSVPLASGRGCASRNMDSPRNCQVKGLTASAPHAHVPVASWATSARRLLPGWLPAFATGNAHQVRSGSTRQVTVKPSRVRLRALAAAMYWPGWLASSVWRSTSTHTCCRMSAEAGRGGPLPLPLPPCTAGMRCCAHAGTAGGGSPAACAARCCCNSA